MPGILILCLIEYFDRLIDPATRIKVRKPVENTIFPLIDEDDMKCNRRMNPSFIKMQPSISSSIYNLDALALENEGEIDGTLAKTKLT